MKLYEDFLEEMLANVPDDLDKREGSPIYVALAPFAAMLAEQETRNLAVQDATMPDTASGDDLTRICDMFGVPRKNAAKAVRKGVFKSTGGNPAVVTTGARFGAEGIIYIVRDRQEAGVYQMECQLTGDVGNQYFGAILPIDNIPNLESATLEAVLAAGSETETDDSLRARLYERMQSRPFGGNKAQYKQEIRAIEGVQDVEVFRAPGGIGGHVQCVIVAPGMKAAGSALIQRVQNLIDPTPQGQGLGLAPIYHEVTISSVNEISIAFSASVALRAGYTLEGIHEEVNALLSKYLESVAFIDNTIRIARMEAAIIGIQGVTDITQSTLNGAASNVTLPMTWDDYQVPVLGEVILSEVP